jgi:hypothetical protein
MALGLPTLHKANSIFAIAGAAAVLVRRVLPYAFALYMLYRH